MTRETHPRIKELTKLLKGDILLKVIELENKLDEVNQLANNQKYSDATTIRKLEESEQSLKNQLSNQVDHLENIRNAIETIVALRYPDVQLNPSWQMSNEPRPANEPEELLALRHIYKLTGF